MPRNGSGGYTLPNPSGFNSGDTADGSKVIGNDSDLGTEMAASIAKDGQTTPTANLPMGGFRHTNAGLATARTHYGRADQTQDGALIWGGVAGGTADAATISLTPAITAYATGMGVRFVSSGANTGAMTLNINSVGAGAVTKEGATALAAGDIPSGALVEVVYDGANFQLTSVSRRSAALSAEVQLTGVLTPSQITADQNNYNPTDLAKTSTLRLDTDAARTITGLQGGANGRVMLIHYIGANSVTLANESASSTAANRFDLAGNIILRPGDVLSLQYDSTSNRWRAFGKTPPVVNFPSADGALGQLLKTDGAGALSFSNPMTSETPVATTSGTSVTLADDLTALATATKIVIRFNGVSTNTDNDPPVLRIGPTGGAVSSGYVGSTAVKSGTSLNEATFTDGIHTVNAFAFFAANQLHGKITLERDDTSEHYWQYFSDITDDSGAYSCQTTGFITLAGQIADMLLTTTDGTAAFDNGEAVVNHS